MWNIYNIEYISIIYTLYLLLKLRNLKLIDINVVKLVKENIVISYSIASNPLVRISIFNDCNRLIDMNVISNN